VLKKESTPEEFERYLKQLETLNITMTKQDKKRIKRIFARLD
jgi:hypothetical protein